MPNKLEELAKEVIANDSVRIAAIRHNYHLTHIIVLYKNNNGAACVAFPMAACNFHVERSIDELLDRKNVVFDICTALLQNYVTVMLRDISCGPDFEVDDASKCLTMHAMFPHIDDIKGRDVPSIWKTAHKALLKPTDSFQTVFSTMSKTLDEMLLNRADGDERIFNATCYIPNVISPKRGNNDDMNGKIHNATKLFKKFVAHVGSGQSISTLFAPTDAEKNIPVFKLDTHGQLTPKTLRESSEMDCSNVRRIVHHINKYLENVHEVWYNTGCDRVDALQSVNGTMMNHKFAHGDDPHPSAQRKKEPLVEFPLKSDDDFKYYKELNIAKIKEFLKVHCSCTEESTGDVSKPPPIGKQPRPVIVTSDVDDDEHSDDEDDEDDKVDIDDGEAELEDDPSPSLIEPAADARADDDASEDDENPEIDAVDRNIRIVQDMYRVHMETMQPIVDAEKRAVEQLKKSLADADEVLEKAAAVHKTSYEAARAEYNASKLYNEGKRKELEEAFKTVERKWIGEATRGLNKVVQAAFEDGKEAGVEEHEDRQLLKREAELQLELDRVRTKRQRNSGSSGSDTGENN